MSVGVPGGYLGVFAQCRNELAYAILDWDFSQCFYALNPDYDGDASVEIVAQWPDTRLDDLQSTTNGQMTKPIISLIHSHSSTIQRSLGNITDLRTPSPPAAGMKRIATRVKVAILVSCWADLQLGGYELVESLAGHIQACAFANQSRLATFRHLLVHNTNTAYEDRPGIVTVDLVVEGDALVSIDVPVSY